MDAPEHRRPRSEAAGLLRRSPAAVAFAFLLFCGCRAERTPPVTVLAAASTADAVSEVATQFTKETGTEVRVSPGPSNALARQVLNGAPADLFLSANMEWADAVRDAGKAADVRPLLANRLVLIVPKGNPAGVATAADLASDRVRHVALAGEGVPAGRYAESALTALKLFAPLASSGKLTRGHDVRVTLTFVERGEADAGVVYATDAAASKSVAVVQTFDASLHEPIVYPAVLIKGGPAEEAGRRFFEFLDSPQAAEVFRRRGFLPANARKQAP